MISNSLEVAGIGCENFIVTCAHTRYEDTATSPSRRPHYLRVEEDERHHQSGN